MMPDDAFDEPVDLPVEVTAQLNELFAQRMATAVAIAETLARDAGLGALEDLAPPARQALEETVEEACNDWRGPELAAGESEPPHERLLRRYYDLGETILGVQSAALRRALGGRRHAEAWRVAKA